MFYSEIVSQFIGVFSFAFSGILLIQIARIILALLFKPFILKMKDSGKILKIVIFIDSFLSGKFMFFGSPWQDDLEKTKRNLKTGIYFLIPSVIVCLLINGWM